MSQLLIHPTVSNPVARLLQIQQQLGQALLVDNNIIRLPSRPRRQRPQQGPQGHCPTDPGPSAA